MEQESVSILWFQQAQCTLWVLESAETMSEEIKRLGL